MIERYKMSEKNVIPIGTVEAGSTAGNVENVVAYLNDNSDILKRHRIAILSPRFQKERAQMMFDANPYFKEKGVELDWLVVEDILERRDPRYKKWADAVYKTPEAKINKEMEERGIRDLKEGTYGAGERPKE